MLRRDVFKGLVTGTAGLLTLGGSAFANTNETTKVDALIGGETLSVNDEVDTYKTISGIDIVDLVELNHDNISLVPNPPVQLQLVAIRANPRAILSIQNPCDHAFAEAFNKSPNLVVEYPDVDHKWKVFALKKNPHLIVYFENPSEDMLWIALKSNSDVISRICNTDFALTEEMRIYAIEHASSPYIGRKLGKLTDKELMATVKRDPCYLLDADHENNGWENTFCWSDEVEAAAIAANPHILDRLALETYDVGPIVQKHQLKMLDDCGDDATKAFKLFSKMVRPNRPSDEVCLAFVKKFPFCAGFLDAEYKQSSPMKELLSEQRRQVAEKIRTMEPGIFSDEKIRRWRPYMHTV